MSNRWPSEIRLLAMVASFVALSWVVVWRLGVLQIDRHEHYSEKARGQHYKKIVIQPERGEIADCRGRTLASSYPRMSVYVDPRKLSGEPQAWAGLFAEALGVSYSQVVKTLSAKSPVPLARRMEPERVSRIAAISDEYRFGHDALWFHRESQRVYPRGVAAQLLGYCTTDGDGDNCGISGLEMQYDENLKGQRLTARLERSAIRTLLGPVNESAYLQARGERLVLTLDAALQESVEQALNRAVELHQADSGIVIIQETKTGAIRAMCSYPGFDNNRFSTATAGQRRNRCLTDPIEPGSVAKIYTIAILFDLNRMGPDDMIHCEGGRISIHGRRVTDSPGHTLYLAPLREVFRYSSNVGTVKAAQLVTPVEYHDMLQRFGFGRRTGIDLPGEGEGLLYPVSRWTAMSMSSLPMGYEMALTPIQIVTAVSGIINDGEMMMPYVVAERQDARGRTIWKAQPTTIRQVVRPSTSSHVRELMEEVVVCGTGKKAQVENYRTGGKTGTTRKSHHLYQREYIASFVGAIPIDDPQLTIFCSIDNPKGAYYAGEVSAPLFKEVATAALAQLAIAPTGPPKVDSSRIARSAQPKADPEKVANAMFHAVSERMVTGPDEMPDLAGMTMSEVRRALLGTQLHVRFLGKGYVMDQSPAPGTRLESTTKAVVIFRDSVRPSNEEDTGGTDGTNSSAPALRTRQAASGPG